MKLEDYQKFTGQAPHPYSIGKNQLFHYALGLAGECGEVCDAIKKREYHGRDIPDEHLKEELGDVMWYVSNLCNELGFKLDDVIDYNVEKLNKRYNSLYNKENKNG